MKNRSFCFLATYLAMLPLPAQEVTPATFERGLLLRASDLLPPELVAGSSHRVREQVVTDGFMAHFVIDSYFGTFEAVGLPQVHQRIKEIDAIRLLTETSKSDLFAEGLKRSIEQPVEAVKNIVKDPIESIKQAPKTVGHFFGKVGSAVDRGFDRIVDRTKQAPDDEVIPDVSGAGQDLENAGKGIIGYDKALLDCAKQLGVDPYSDNKQLQDEMEKVAWAFFAGGLPLRIGSIAASAGLVLTVTKAVGVPEEIYALTSNEIASRDEKSLKAMGVTELDIEAFYNNRVLTITTRHQLVRALESLSKAAGRGLLVRLASSCQSARQVDFMLGALGLLVSRQQAGSATYVELRVIGRLPGGVTSEGVLEVPAPVDYVTWTPEVAGFAQRDDLPDMPKVLVHTGVFSPVAAANFASNGWKTFQVPYPAP
jgi:hypothetical protein